MTADAAATGARRRASDHIALVALGAGLTVLAVGCSESTPQQGSNDTPAVTSPAHHGSSHPSSARASATGPDESSTPGESAPTTGPSPAGSSPPGASGTTTGSLTSSHAGSAGCPADQRILYVIAQANKGRLPVGAAITGTRCTGGFVAATLTSNAGPVSVLYREAAPNSVSIGNYVCSAPGAEQAPQPVRDFLSCG